jgi:hypothetical protein
LVIIAAAMGKPGNPGVQQEAWPDFTSPDVASFAQ